MGNKLDWVALPAVLAWLEVEDTDTVVNLILILREYLSRGE